MNLCGTCRHWDQQSLLAGWQVEIRLVQVPGESDADHAERERKAENLFGECQVVKLLDRYERVTEDDLPLAFCRDGSDYRADLYTRAEFGCAMWQPKDL